MQQDAEEEEHKFSQLIGNKGLRDVDEIDEFGNKRTVQKLVDNVGPKQSPNSNNLRSKIITITDSNGNEIKKLITSDDKGNIIDQDDVEYIDFDEFGNK